MKELIKRLGLRLARPVDQLHYYFNFFNWKRSDHISALNRQTQILLSLQYRAWQHIGMPRLRFDEVEFRSFSQHGEDGILLYVFSLIGTTDRRCVEICAGDGVECNTANLVVNHGWTALMIDGDAHKLRFGRAFYARHLNTLHRPPQLVHAWVERDNVNTLITEHGMTGEIDLLSLDVDGVDYWIWKSISCIQPRVVVLEYNAALGYDRALSVPYRPDFRRQGDHWGASLPAFVKLGHRKGYRLVGCDSSRVNAFFVRAGIAEEILPEVEAAACFALPVTDTARPPQQASSVWVEV